MCIWEQVRITDLTLHKRARSNYIEGQAEIRRELALKKAEKEGMKMLEELVFGPPRGSKCGIGRLVVIGL